MAQDNQQDDPGTDPETQREEIVRRSKVAHAPDQPPFVPATTRPPDREQPAEPKKQGVSSPK